MNLKEAIEGEKKVTPQKKTAPGKPKLSGSLVRVLESATESLYKQIAAYDPRHPQLLKAKADISVILGLLKDGHYAHADVQSLPDIPLAERYVTLKEEVSELRALAAPKPKRGTKKK